MGLCVACAPACADISPTQFVGSGIVARPETNVRMEKAVVDIVWGAPCQMTATFRMVNSSSEPQSIRVGFPMPGMQTGFRWTASGEPDLSAVKAPEGLSITFNGKPAQMTAPELRRIPTGPRHDWIWYHCEHTFNPGVTTVVVQTPLRASLVYGGLLQESLFYCIETGGYWNGTIGEEEVTIRFPQPIEQGQIVSAAPAGCEVSGNLVRWRFTDFEPKGKSHDIALTYLHPEAMKVLAALRRDVAKDPASAAAAIKLAKHLLALGYAKSNGAFLPHRFTAERWDAIVGSIATEQDKKVFAAQYRKQSNGAYQQSGTEWTEERTAALRVLVEAGYRDDSSRAAHILEGERLLKETLAREPHNAEAWNVYLANYWRFSFGAVGHWFRSAPLGTVQAALIETAAANCPQDETISLWLGVRRNASSGELLKKLDETIESRGWRKTEFPEIQYKYY